MKKKQLVTMVLSVFLVVATTISAFAYQINYSTLPTDYKTRIDNAWFNNYPDDGPDRMSLTAWQGLSAIFPDTATPTWSSISSFNNTNLADQSDANAYFSANWIAVAARCIYAENTNVGTGTTRENAMCATADVISNRSRYSGYGGSISGAVLKPGQFACMRDGNYAVRNPFFYTSDLNAYGYAVMIASHMSSDGSTRFILSDRYFHFYDISSSMPFYKKNANGTYTVCTSSNVTSATHYKSGSTYYPIKSDAPPVKYGTHVYFSY